ncbi:MAG TPA: type II secretion system protein GspG [Planctomycetota bacterium]|nr:type II secretion system protein GspG [Planctomycetota bacterium]
MKKALLLLAVLATLGLVVATGLAYRERRAAEARSREDAERKATTLERLQALKELVDARGATTDVYPPVAEDEIDSDTILPLQEAEPFLRLFNDPWGRPIKYRRPGPVHKDGWDVYSLGADGKGTDRDLYLGASYVPDPRSARVDETYGRETRERLEACRAIVLELKEKPESEKLEDLLAALKAQGLESRRARFMDLWGHKLRWRCPGRVHPKGWDLYSIGPNGEDEEGAGDDILIGADAR